MSTAKTKKQTKKQVSSTKKPEENKSKTHKVVMVIGSVVAFLAGVVAILAWLGLEPSQYYQNKAETYNNQGYDYLQQANYEQAIECFTKAIALEKHHIENIDTCYFNRGHAYYKSEEMQKAIDDFTTAIALNPKSKYYGERALAYGAIGDTENQMKDNLSALK